MPHSLPHKIEASAVEAFFANLETEYASAPTHDQTQRKRLRRRGTGLYIVDRRYYLEPKQWIDVYSGTDLDEAVRFYNRLS